jgi:threonine dehydratase
VKEIRPAEGPPPPQPLDDAEYADLMRRLREARGRLAGVAHRTPVLHSETLDRAAGTRVFLKAECFQRMGAFKFRGAWNFVSQIPEPARARGVVAYSSGNHAQAVALVARMHRIPAVIVMPSTAPAPKLAAVHDYGAEIHHYDLAGEGREAMAERLAAARGLTLVPPFDHPDIVAGQGTAAFELFEDAGPMDALLVPVGGGGLLAGAALAASSLLMACEVAGVEPAGADDAARSFRSGRLERCDRPDTIADGARTPSLGTLNFRIVRALVGDIVTVTDDEMVSAMRFAFERLKIVLEPTGAMGLAALLSRRFEVPWARVGVILSGGNVDPADALRWISGARALGA